jgi:hypothetical protein
MGKRNVEKNVESELTLREEIVERSSVVSPLSMMPWGLELCPRAGVVEIDVE